MKERLYELVRKWRLEPAPALMMRAETFQICADELEAVLDNTPRGEAVRGVTNAALTTKAMAACQTYYKYHAAGMDDQAEALVAIIFDLVTALRPKSPSYETTLALIIDLLRTIADPAWDPEDLAADGGVTQFMVARKDAQEYLGRYDRDNL